MSEFANVVPVQTRILPVVLILDTSGSMREDDKIDVLNESVLEMINELNEVDAGHGYITLTLITFGGENAKVIQRNTPVASITFTPLKAGGQTPMGDAFLLASELIENQEEISSKAYRPTIALVSDGLPVPSLTDELDSLLRGKRGSKSSRFVIAIGADADQEMLAKFSSTGDVRVASEAAEIRNFLQWVTNTVTQNTITNLDSREKQKDLSDDSIKRLRQDDAF